MSATHGFFYSSAIYLDDELRGKLEHLIGPNAPAEKEGRRAGVPTWGIAAMIYTRKYDPPIIYRADHPTPKVEKWRTPAEFFGSSLIAR